MAFSVVSDVIQIQYFSRVNSMADMFLINIVYVFKFYTILTFQSWSFPMEAQDYQSCVVLL